MLFNESGYVALRNAPAETLPLLEEEVSARSGSQISNDDSDIVQFSMPEFIVEADAGHIELHIMRVGRKTGKVKVAFRTQENSAKAGIQFEQVSGTLVMQPGEDQSCFKVKINNCPRWNPTTEFKVILFDAEGCTLGLYLKEARVNVIDMKIFPTNEFRAQIAAGDVTKISHFKLYKVFMVHFMGDHSIWWRSLITIFFDQLKNVYYYVRLVLSVYLVDTLLDLDSTEGFLVKDDRQGTAYVVATLFFAPPLLFFVTDTIVLSLDVPGRLRRNMSRGLFTKFMNYSMESLHKHSSGELAGAFNEDIHEAVMGFTSLLDVIRLAGKFVLSVLFLLQHNPRVWWVTLMVPALMITWAGFRTHAFVAAAEAAGVAASKATDFLHETMSKLPLISAYGQRPQINDIFLQKCEDVRTLQLPERRVHRTNMFLPAFVGPGLTAFYIVFRISNVLNGSLDLGLFLGTLNVFDSICSDFSEVFGRLMDIISTFENLTNLTRLFNNPTDLKQRQQRNLVLEKHTDEKRHQLSGDIQRNSGYYVPRVDRLKIEATDLSFSYGNLKVFEGINFECEQGVICAIKANPGQGKKTLVDLLTSRLFPTSGSIFIPRHLRCLYVHSEIMIMKLSIWQNLVFGDPHANNAHRVEKILKYFGMTRTLELCQSDCDRCKKIGYSSVTSSEPQLVHDQEHQKIEMLSETEKMNICLVRALIMNPEVMVLHRPFLHYHSKKDDDALIAALRRHRDERGVLLPEEEIMKRRPRTIFLTTDRTDIIHEVSDVCWVLPSEASGASQTLHRQHFGGIRDSRLVNSLDAHPNTNKSSPREQSRDKRSWQSVDSGFTDQPGVQSDNTRLLALPQSSDAPFNAENTTRENLWPLRRKGTQ